jgi:hypothetical protein
MVATCRLFLKPAFPTLRALRHAPADQRLLFLRHRAEAVYADEMADQDPAACDRPRAPSGWDSKAD